ncbi:MAG TPA: MarR family transcriptional regulator [Candidatus Limnocylindrales bacterium]|jgi:DNA-binding MarR family transcriptional regulator
MEPTQTPTAHDGLAVVDERLIGALDELVGAAVGVTTVALAQTVIGQDLTLPQWRALVVISSTDGLRVSDVAARIGMSRPSMTRLVQRLQRRGVIVAEPDPSDGRATILRATAAGMAMRVATMTGRRRLIVEALGSRPETFSPDLAHGLTAIARALERYR